MRASHNLGKALGEGLGLLCVPFTSLSPSLSFTFFLSYLSLPLYISPSTFLSLSLFSIILFGVSIDVFVLVLLLWRRSRNTFLLISNNTFFWLVISFQLIKNKLSSFSNYAKRKFMAKIE
jgi:hypothetical protein